ncbi:MAG: tetratricopeptide repeat protein, partial [Rhodospirillales bacterium]|nr:tetratricopeptide repeat protein [Rhodospirillales bacterium]
MRYAALLLLAAVAGCAAPQNATTAAAGSPGERIVDAALSAGTPDVAIRVSSGLLAQDPKNVGLLMRQANAYIMTGNRAAAADDYRRVLTIQPGLETAELGLGKLLIATDPHGAQVVYQGILARQPRNAEALSNLGVALDLQGQHAAAQKSYREALVITPNAVPVRQNLGLSLAVSGNPEEAVQILGQLAREGDNDRRVRDNLAMALALTGRTDEADKMLREELSPADAEKALAAYSQLAANTAP